MGVDTAWLGQRVWAFTGLGGGYAEQVVAPAEGLILVPSNLSSVDAVTIGGPGVVAHFGLRHAHFTHGESVLVRGAVGPLGIITIQLAVRSGASVVAVTTSSVERGERLRQLGATHVMNRVAAGGQDAHTGYYVIIDVVAGADMSSFFASLNPNGRMVAIGAVGGFPPADFANGMFASFQKSMSVATFSSNSVIEADRRAKTTELFASANRGELQVIVDEVLPLEQAIRAHQKMEVGGVFGRILLAPSSR
ncbi:MAG: hypothetical protein JWQ22_2298 [Devosia sp.]|nr:hypothetical protein [Devosia sp.]